MIAFRIRFVVQCGLLLVLMAVLAESTGYAQTSRVRERVARALEHAGKANTPAAVQDGSGIFFDTGQQLGTDESFGIALGDLDGDGDLDAFVANATIEGTPANRVWFNDGQGNFTDSGQRLGAGFSNDVALGDLDGDGDLDAFVANGLFGDPNRVWINNGAGFFSDSGQQLGNEVSYGVALGDLDLDGDLDAYVANGLGEVNTDQVLLNDGNGRFTAVDQAFEDFNSTAVALGDLDGDGDLDAFVTNAFFEGNFVQENLGNGNFTQSNTGFGFMDGEDVALADLNGDRALDIVVANLGLDAPLPNQVWFNNGNNTFSDSEQRLGSAYSSAIALGDFDDDGDVDIFFTNEDTGNEVWLNDGAGTFTDSGQFFGDSGSLDVAVGDLDGDLDLDAFIGNVGANTVFENQDIPEVNISDGSGEEGDTEGGGARFNVTLSTSTLLTVMVVYETRDGTAVAPDDYVAGTDTLFFFEGETQHSIFIPFTGDTAPEGNETFAVELTEATNATITDGSGTGTILDDDGVLVTIDDVPVGENAGQASFTVSVTPTAIEDVSLDYNTTDGSATAGQDYTAVEGTLVLSAGSNSATIDVPILNDALDELEESFSVVLSNPDGGILTNDTGIGTITDDDPQPQLSVDDASAAEGDGEVTFSLTLSAVSGRDVEVSYATQNGTAQAGNDYEQTSGTATIPAGETTETISVALQDDELPENVEAFTLQLTEADGAVIADGIGAGEILDDDVPSVSVGDVDTGEGAGTLDFTISLDREATAPVTVSYATEDGTAVRGEDYTQASGEVTIPIGAASNTVSVTVLNDSIDEGSEAFDLVLLDVENGIIVDGVGTATIADNDPPPVLSVQDATVSEAEDEAVVTVALSTVSGRDVTVEYATADGTATAGADYVQASGTAAIPAGELETSIRISLQDDQGVEGDEAFTVQLSNPRRAELGDAEGIVTIEDDEALVGLSVNDISIQESAGAAVFTVRLAGAVAGQVTVDYATADGSASAGPDYESTSGTLTFSSGVTSREVSVTVQDDQLDEGEEDFFLNLSNAVGSTISDEQGRGRIQDDDGAEVLLAESGGVTVVGEGGATDTYTLALSTIPLAAVSITAQPSNDQIDLGAGAGEPVTLTFNANASALNPQTINIAAVDDADDEGFHASTISHAVFTLDPAYLTATVPDVAVTVLDNEASVGVSPETLEFVAPGIGRAVDDTVVLTNTGMTDVTITSVAITGVNQEDFSILSGDDAGVIVPDATRDIVVQFQPLSGGEKRANLEIQTSVGTVVVSMGGIGIGPALSVTPQSVVFGSVLVGTPVTRTLTLKNIGTAPLTIGAATIAGTDFLAFDLTDEDVFFNTFAPNEERQTEIRFLPDRFGDHAARLSIASDGGDLEVLLQGTGGAPNISFEPPAQPPLEGLPFAVTVSTDPSFTPTILQLNYRRTGDHDYTTVDLEASEIPGTYTGEIPAAYVTLQGVDFYVYFSDGTTEVTLPAETPDANPLNVPVQTTRRVSAEFYTPQVYGMVSVPLELDDPGLRVVFEDDYGDPNQGRWRLLRWNDDHYDEYPDIDTSIRPGRAFWLITSDGKAFDVDEGQSVSADEPFSIQLVPGWNQIGVPFAFPVPWSVVTGTEGVEPPVTYNGVEYLYNQTVLEPWMGYFVYNTSSTFTNIGIPPVQFVESNKAGAASGFDGSSYKVQLTARVDAGKLVDTQNWVGFAERAAEGRDALDLGEAPGIGDYVRLSIMEDGRPWAASFKPAGQGQRWDLEVEVVHRNEVLPATKRVVVSLGETGRRPDGFELYVLDLDRHEPVDVSAGSFEVELRPDRPVRRYSVIVGSEAFAASQSEGIPLEALEDRLEQNYPNPFNPETVIEYQISATGHVVLEVFNVLGQRVRTLVDGQQRTGRYQVRWDGRDGGGIPVGSGFYYYRLRSDNYRSSRSMLLLR